MTEYDVNGGWTGTCIGWASFGNGTMIVGSTFIRFIDCPHYDNLPDVAKSPETYVQWKAFWDRIRGPRNDW